MNLTILRVRDAIVHRIPKLLGRLSSLFLKVFMQLLSFMLAGTLFRGSTIQFVNQYFPMSVLNLFPFSFNLCPHVLLLASTSKKLSILTLSNPFLHFEKFDQIAT